ncbi:MAG: RNA polymerase sigma factor [Pirellulales bacterium]
MPPDEHGDELLMNRVRAGEREPLEALLRRHATPLLTFLRRMTTDAHLSEELFQEVFLAVWKHRHQYQYPRPFRPWLYQIAANKCRAAYRGRARRPTISLDVGLDAAPLSSDCGAADVAVAAETKTAVATAVAQLPDRQREVLVMRIWNEQPYAEIAEVLGCTQRTARSHMHHALVAMRRLLAARLP